jgi:DNA-binding MarR family transcriptional regulator
MPNRTALAHELSRNLHELGRMLASRRLQELLHTGAVAGMTPSKHRALDVLAEGDVRVGALAVELGIDDTTATRLVDRLTELGLVSRRPLPEDRRVAVVGLTPAGRALVSDIAVRRQEFFADVLDTLEPAEQVELVRLTAKAADSIRSRSEELVAR